MWAYFISNPVLPFIIMCMNVLIGKFGKVGKLEGGHNFLGYSCRRGHFFLGIPTIYMRFCDGVGGGHFF